MGKIFSIYVTNETTSICEVSRRGENVNLYQTFRIQTPKGCVEDGIIIDTHELAEAIRQVLPEKGYQRHKAVFTVASRRIASKEIVLPYVKNRKTITEIITANVADYFPMSNIKDYVYEYTILEVFEKEGRKQYRLSAVAVQKELLESYRELSKELGLETAAIDYYGNSVFQLMKQQVDGKNTLVLQMEKDVTHVSIMVGKAQVFRRTIPFGERAIVQAVSELKQITEKEAEELLHKENRGIALSEREYKEAVRDVVSSIIRVVDFHVSQNPEVVIEKARLFGEVRNIAGFAEVMERELNVPVTAPRRLEGIMFRGSRETVSEDITPYLPNLGAVLDSLDLKSEEEEKQGVNLYRVYGLVLGGTALISIALAAVTLVRYFDAQQKKVQLEAEIEKVRDIEELYMRYGASLADLEVIKGYYESTRSPNETLYQLLVDLETVIPESVGIVNLDSKEGELNITGIASGKEAVAAFVMELKKLSYVTDVWVKDITDTYDELGTATSIFNMTFRLQSIEEGGEENEAE